MCQNARQGVVHKHSPMCKKIACTLDFVYGQSRCLLCEPIYEAFFDLSSCEPMMICTHTHTCKFVIIGWSDQNHMMCTNSLVMSPFGSSRPSTTNICAPCNWGLLLSFAGSDQTRCTSGGCQWEFKQKAARKASQHRPLPRGGGSG
jgi:hypothetical protein